MRSSLKMFVATAEDMEALGARVAGVCAAPCVVYLEGELGTGKTTFVRGYLHGMGYMGAVKSPTFTLVEPYDTAGCRVYHLDLYRLADPRELEYMGARDYFDGRGACLVEWPERGAGALPAPDLRIRLRYHDGGREVGIGAESTRGQEAMSRLSLSD